MSLFEKTEKLRKSISVKKNIIFELKKEITLLQNIISPKKDIMYYVFVMNSYFDNKNTTLLDIKEYTERLRRYITDSRAKNIFIIENASKIELYNKIYLIKESIKGKINHDNVVNLYLHFSSHGSEFLGNSAISIVSADNETVWINRLMSRFFTLMSINIFMIVDACRSRSDHIPPYINSIAVNNGEFVLLHATSKNETSQGKIDNVFFRSFVKNCENNNFMGTKNFLQYIQSCILYNNVYNLCQGGIKPKIYLNDKSRKIAKNVDTLDIIILVTEQTPHDIYATHIAIPDNLVDLDTECKSAVDINKLMNSIVKYNYTIKENNRDSSHVKTCKNKVTQYIEKYISTKHRPEQITKLKTFINKELIPSSLDEELSERIYEVLNKIKFEYSEYKLPSNHTHIHNECFDAIKECTKYTQYPCNQLKECHDTITQYLDVLNKQLLGRIENVTINEHDIHTAYMYINYFTFNSFDPVKTIYINIKEFKAGTLVGMGNTNHVEQLIDQMRHQDIITLCDDYLKSTKFNNKSVAKIIQNTHRELLAETC